MPDYQLGVGFQPGQQEAGGRASAPTPAQQIIKLLSLRLPTVVGAHALAPQALLQGQGGQAIGGDAGLALLRRLLAMSGAAGPGLMGGGGGAPSAPFLGQQGAGSAAPDWMSLLSSTHGPIPTPRIIPREAPEEAPTEPDVPYDTGPIFRDMRESAPAAPMSRIPWQIREKYEP